MSDRLGRVITRRFDTKEQVYSLTCAPVANASGQLKGATMTFMHTDPD